MRIHQARPLSTGSEGRLPSFSTKKTCIILFGEICRDGMLYAIFDRIEEGAEEKFHYAVHFALDTERTASLKCFLVNPLSCPQ